MLFLRKVWGWLKKYWKYLLFPVGIVLGILGVLAKRKDLGDIVAPKEVETEEERDEANAEATRLSEQAKIVRDAKVEFLKREHAETIEELTDKQKAQVDELEEDPDALNEFLLGVGKEIRG